MGLTAEPITKSFLLGLRMFGFLNENFWLWEWTGEGLNVEESIISRIDFFSTWNR